jgi:cytochrome P450
MKDRKSQPPGPRGELILGNMRPFIRDPLAFLTQAARQYGKVVCFPFLHRKFYLLSDPDDIELVLVKYHTNFIKTASLRTSGVQQVMGNGLVTSEGEFWRKQRRLAQPGFHRERIAGYSHLAVSFADQMLKRWKPSEPVDLHKEMMRLTLRVVAKTLFNADVSRDNNEIGQALDTCIRQFATQWTFRGIFLQRFPTADRRRLHLAVKKLNNVIYRIISEHRKEGDSNDLLSMLMSSQDEDGSQMTDEQLRDEAMTLFLAGHETTAILLCWTWLFLMQTPVVEEKLHAELRTILDGRLPTFDDLPKLRYAEQIIKESMRLYPPIWGVARQALGDFEASGYRIPAGSEVIMSQWVNHRDSKYFEEPQEFRPERWTEEFAKQLPKFAYFPFSAGPRNCIGSGFVMMESVLVLATMAQRISLQRTSSDPITLFPSIIWPTSRHRAA